MRMNKIKNSDDAVVGVVVAVLLVGLVVSFVSLVQTVYVPKWMEQQEAEHMEEVATQFAQLKLAIDTQSVNEQEDTPIATSITLGNKELPFLMSARAFGHLEILSDECIITISKTGTSPTTYSLGTIKYSSANAYFLNQDYIYETGAILINQSQGDVMSVRPSFSASKETDVLISFTLVDISGVGGKISGSGYGTSPIQTEFLSSDAHYISDVSSITITTSYPTAWYVFINSTLSPLEKEEPGQDFFDIYIDGNKVIVNFTKPGGGLSGVDLSPLKIINIGAQIGPGWVE